MSLRRKYIKENELGKNKSCYFLLPIYGYALVNNSPIEPYLINCYITDNYKFYIVLDNINDDERLGIILHNLQGNVNYLDSFYEDEGKEIIILMDIPVRFRDDFDLFVLGKYTKFSLGFKDNLCKYFGKKSSRKERNKSGVPVKRVFDIIYPTKEKIEDIAEYLLTDIKNIEDCGEIIDSPDMKVETFRRIDDLLRDNLE